MSPTTVLLTLGRLPKGLELARGFSALGCRVLVAEPHAWHVCRLSRHVARSVRTPAPRTHADAYAESLRRFIERENVAHILPVSEESPYVLNAVADTPLAERVFSPPQDLAARLNDKHQFCQSAAVQGLTVPDTFAADDPACAALAADSATVLKPTHGCSGEGVRFFERGARPPAPRGHIVQRKISGRHVSSFSIAQGGVVRTSALYEGTLLSGTVAVCFRRVTDTPQVLEWIERFVRAYDLSGFVSFDFIVDADGVPWAIECNPRTTSGIHFLEPRDVARAILEPASAEPIRFRRRRHFQQFYPALTEAYRTVLRPREFARRLRTVLTARDVVFDWRDLTPFVLMTPASWPILRQTLFDGKTFGAAATADIAWPPPTGEPPSET